ncbi:hypothetical protein BDP55DRAFT_715979 [Colletotrichum godetiae]|uniref:Uncharacterized protein n=1 Tax=Colletotrichum godetiae TaxID=1209918 RepID=A0AAJ0AKJ1_9PEZI|nr:uncharacterized protein BDP55DRAFT_715979 [Colletotrichum godetiae]KAK1674930.1 hypothetical protein BDP55DRAFT_715979 [Colletotrichum godetiae]
MLPTRVYLGFLLGRRKNPGNRYSWSHPSWRIIANSKAAMPRIVRRNRKYDDSMRRGFHVAMSSGATRLPVNRRIAEFKAGSLIPFGSDFSQIYPWHRDITVDSNTGSISLWLIRLAPVGSAHIEALEEFVDDLTLYRINSGPGQSFLIGSHHSLDRLLKQDDEHFAPDPERSLGSSESDQLVFMVLRKRGDGLYRLTNCFSYLCFCPMPSPTPYKEPRFLNELQESVQVAQRKRDLQYKLNPPVCECGLGAILTYLGILCPFRLAFPENEDTKLGHGLPIFTGHESFERLQENEVCARRRQQVIENYLEFGFEIDFATQQGNNGGRVECVHDGFPSRMEWEWRRTGEENRSL